MNDLFPEYEAARLLARQKKIGRGIWVKELDYGRRIIFDTFENYRRICRVPEGIKCEGCTVVADGVTIVLYNGGWDVGRINYTLAHEVGHVLLGHREGEEDEEEANRFASALLLPYAVVRALGRVSAGTLADFFGCSLTAAGYALHRANIVTPYDREILSLFDGRLRAFRAGRNPLDISCDL